MIKAQALVSIALGSILISGCGLKTEYLFVNEKDTGKFKFEKIDTSGVYIDMGNKEIQRICSPKMVELNNVYKGILEFYDDQIDRYNGSNGGSDEDSK